MNRLDPSGELRAGFGEAYQVAADKPPISNRIIGLRERFYPPDPFRSASHRHGLGMFRGAIDYSCTKADFMPIQPEAFSRILIYEALRSNDCCIIPVNCKKIKSGKEVGC